MLIGIAYHVVHLTVIFLNVAGWSVARLRTWSFACQAITLSCWVGFGIAKGQWGFCPLTEYHWRHLRGQGEVGLPGNYVAYIFDRWLGLPMSDGFAAGLVLGCFAMAVAINLYLLKQTKVNS